MRSETHGNSRGQQSHQASPFTNNRSLTKLIRRYHQVWPVLPNHQHPFDHGLTEVCHPFLLLQKSEMPFSGGSWTHCSSISAHQSPPLATCRLQLLSSWLRFPKGLLQNHSMQPSSPVYCRKHRSSRNPPSPFAVRKLPLFSSDSGAETAGCFRGRFPPSEMVCFHD
jgi:hypothetical protein